MNTEILRYEKKYKNDFKKLNLEWLQKYFEVEPIDEKILYNPMILELHKESNEPKK